MPLIQQSVNTIKVLTDLSLSFVVTIPTMFIVIWFPLFLQISPDIFLTPANNSPDGPSQESSCIDDNQSTPYVLPVLQLFKTHDKARATYMEHADRISFNVRMGTTKVIDVVLSQRRMVCAKQGIYSLVISEAVSIPRKKCRIRNSQCSCDAMFYMVLDNVLNQWWLVSFIEQHNHEMVSPSKRRYLQVNMVITLLSRTLFQSLSTLNNASSDQYSVAANEAGSYLELSFTPSEFSNMRRNQRMLGDGRDADLFLEWLAELKNIDSGFFYKTSKHNNGRLCNIFWVDSIAWADFQMFGDSITFDMT